MAREILFSGDELELLNALDRAGCVLTDAGRFSCDMEKDALPFNSRLPVRFKGEYHSAENGWKITYRIQPAPRTMVIGGIFALLMLLSLLFARERSGTMKGALVFAVLLLGMAVNFVGQKDACIRRFENLLLRGVSLE